LLKQLVTGFFMDKDIHAMALKLIAYCQADDWAGYEPYDALNSKVLAALPFLDSRIPRLVLTQALKRSPINVRRLLLIPKTQNPKAVAVFLSAFLKLPQDAVADRESYVDLMIERLITLRSQGVPFWCWGYNFPWQTRTVLVPRWAPNLIPTVFAATALLDVYETSQDTRCLNMAISAAEYILNELYWADEGCAVGFSYPLSTLRNQNQVHNANFLAAALLCRISKCTGDKKFLPAALSVVRYSASKQHPDGGWSYGERPTQRWIDNFHTAWNLSALQSVGRYADTTEFASCIRRGFDFYRAHFFREDGAVGYYHNQFYPLDTHCVAQSIITLLELKDLDPGNVPLAHSVFRWAMDHMWDDRGFFYYRKLRSCTIRTSYMRWTQAWMLLALSMLLSESNAMVSTAACPLSAASVEA
jgi:hypothetical protein